MPPRTVHWELDEHSLGKHLVLEKYMGAWLPILGQSEPRILVVDGFAGPGTYKGGEIGSPLIVLKAIEEHPALSRINEVQLAFIEADKNRYDALVAAIKERHPESARTARVSVMPHHGTFQEVIELVREHIAARRAQMAPAFVMLDPFGVKGVRFADIQWIFSQPKTETFISFMGSWVNRFFDSDEFAPHLDTLFGDTAWRQLSVITDFGQRQAAFLTYMETRLRVAGGKHVVRFDLWSGNVYKYSIYFAGKHSRGCDRMKQAIWKAMPNGSYTFIGSGGAQLQIGFNDLPLTMLDQELRAFLQGRGWTAVQELSAYIESDRSRFHSGHLKKALGRLEASGHIEVDPSSRKKRGSYPDGTRLRSVTQAVASGAGNSE